jgi:tRNA 2-thiouridine synthesizing protein A
MEHIDQKLDMKGQVCPIPAAETRKMLKSLSPGQILEVIGDFECACDNVVKMAMKNGGEIVSADHGQNYFRVVIKKTP